MVNAPRCSLRSHIHHGFREVAREPSPRARRASFTVTAGCGLYIPRVACATRFKAETTQPRSTLLNPCAALASG